MSDYIELIGDNSNDRAIIRLDKIVSILPTEEGNTMITVERCNGTTEATGFDIAFEDVETALEPIKLFSKRYNSKEEK